MTLDQLHMRLEALIRDQFDGAETRKDAHYRAADLTSALITAAAATIVANTVEPVSYEMWLRDTNVALVDFFRKQTQERLRRERAR